MTFKCGLEFQLTLKKFHMALLLLKENNCAVFFFSQTIRDWNFLTDSLISASECAEDSDTKFTSLVRTRD